MDSFVRIDPEMAAPRSIERLAEARSGETKNIQGRMLLLTPELREILSTQLEWTLKLPVAIHSPIPWIFHCDDRPIKDYYGGWDKACRLGGFPDRARMIFAGFKSGILSVSAYSIGSDEDAGAQDRVSIGRRAIVDEAMFLESGKTRSLSPRPKFLPLTGRDQA
jgi:hypothetical protein